MERWIAIAILILLNSLSPLEALHPQASEPLQTEVLFEDLGVSADSTFFFPSSLRMIEEDAFSGTAAETLILPEGFLLVLDNAFAGTDSLSNAYIPWTTVYIADNAFSGDSGLVIHGIEGSYAHNWAKKHDISFAAEDIWRLTFHNDKTTDARQAGLTVRRRTVVPDISTIVPRAEYTYASMRPQDRPELNPIDYRFP